MQRVQLCPMPHRVRSKPCRGYHLAGLVLQRAGTSSSHILTHTEASCSRYGVTTGEVFTVLTRSYVTHLSAAAEPIACGLGSCIGNDGRKRGGTGGRGGGCCQATHSLVLLPGLPGYHGCCAGQRCICTPVHCLALYTCAQALHFQIAQSNTKPPRMATKRTCFFAC